MFKKSLIAVAVALFAFSNAEAKCNEIPQSDYATVIVEQNRQKIAVFGDLPGPFQVVVQDQRTCKVSNLMTMTEDQLYTKFGIADELEGECVDNPECG